MLHAIEVPHVKRPVVILFSMRGKPCCMPYRSHMMLVQRAKGTVVCSRPRDNCIDRLQPNGIVVQPLCFVTHCACPLLCVHWAVRSARSGAVNGQTILVGSRRQFPLVLAAQQRSAP